MQPYSSHALVTMGSQTYCYDRNGNLRRGGGRELTWTIENMPATIKGTDGITERYGYDASGANAADIDFRSSATMPPGRKGCKTMSFKL